jgi:hypothetical protein
MKILCFTFRGEQYRVNESGHIKVEGLDYYSSNWIFLGGSRSHLSKTIDISLGAAFENPDSLNGCLGWDRDYGTLRQWGGRYNGKLPRISLAYVANA